MEEVKKYLQNTEPLNLSEVSGFCRVSIGHIVGSEIRNSMPTICKVKEQGSSGQEGCPISHEYLQV